MVINNMNKDLIFTKKIWESSDEEFFNSIHYSEKYSWRTQFIKSINDELILNNGDFYQVGVYNGSSIKLLIKLFQDYKYKINNIFGFDSFTGLPKEEKDSLNIQSWNEGRFNLVTKDNDIDNVKNKILQFINNENVKLIEGYYKDTMNINTIKNYNMKPASYIDMDCDIYSSTVEALDFFYDNKLLVKGTIIGYDDWSMGNIKKYEYKAGQSKAHQEFCIKNNITFKRLKNYKLWKERAVFIVTEI